MDAMSFLRSAPQSTSPESASSVARPTDPNSVGLQALLPSSQIDEHLHLFLDEYPRIKLLKECSMSKPCYRKVKFSPHNTQEPRNDGSLCA